MYRSGSKSLCNSEARFLDQPLPIGVGLCAIHRSACKGNSANFAFTEFSEVRQERCNKYCNLSDALAPLTGVSCRRYVVRVPHVKEGRAATRPSSDSRSAGKRHKGQRIWSTDTGETE